MDIQFIIRQRINRPVAEVFDAIVDPAKLTCYFMDAASGPLRAGTTVQWTWGSMTDDTIVDEVVTNERIVCRWVAYNVDYQTTCCFEFAAGDDANTTIVKVTESGWKEDQQGLNSAFDHCSGWQFMLLALKAWIEHGIDLRK